MTTSADSAAQRVILPIEGMTCAACVQTVQGALAGPGASASARVVTLPRERLRLRDGESATAT